MNKIPNFQLLETDIPSNSATWSKLLPFAESFDGVEQWGTFEKCREIAKQGIALFRSNQQLSQSLTDLRTCLYYEARRWNHLEKTPNKRGMEYIRALIEAIRVRVLARQLS
jgi:hypothetical protein